MAQLSHIGHIAEMMASLNLDFKLGRANPWFRGFKKCTVTAYHPHQKAVLPTHMVNIHKLIKCKCRLLTGYCKY